MNPIELMRNQVAKARDIVGGPRGPIHMIGVAGVGMAGVAIQLAARGFKVSGCDAQDNTVSRKLKDQGVRFVQGHDAKHVGPELLCVIRTPAVPLDHPEVRAAAAQGIPVLPRGAVLPALLDGLTSIAVGGTHGKTTTTTMITQILRGAGMDASFCIGAEVDALGGVARAGRDPVIVVEADESDGTIALYEPDYAVITNIEMDHVDFFPSRASLFDCFSRFADNARRRVVYSADDLGASDLLKDLPRAFSYGLGEASGAALHAAHVETRPRSMRFQVVSKDWKTGRLEIPIPGIQNVSNALAACAVALDLGVPFDKIRASLAAFRPARRRFETVAAGAGLTVISDYAHHPTEIRCLLRQARGLKPERIVAVFQPHRYSRTLALAKEFPPAFEGIDRLVLAPVYAASEAPVEGGTTDALYRHCVEAGVADVANAATLEDAWERIRSDLKPGDLFLIIGAGDVEKIALWANDELQKRIATAKKSSA